MGVVDYLMRRRVKTLEDRWQILEVTDLTIPQGTNWGSVPRTVLDLPVVPANAFAVAGALLEVTAPPASGDTLYFQMDDMDIGSTTVAAQLTGGQVQLWVAAVDQFLVAQAFTGGLANDSHALRTTSCHLAFNLWTNRALTAPIHIVRARAAFLVF